MLKAIINGLGEFFNGFYKLCGGCSELGAIIIMIPIFIIALLVYSIKELISPTIRPPPPTAEQVQEHREEKYNKTGKAVREFLKGVAGQDKSEKK